MNYLNKWEYVLIFTKHLIMPRKSVALGQIWTHTSHIPGKHPNH